MSNDNTDKGLTPYQFDGRNVRMVEKDGEQWFIASDVARELGYDHTPTFVRSLDDDEKDVHTAHTPGGDQTVTIISEPGLYRGIIQRRANKKHDEALLSRIARFQRWVFHDVLPSIRKGGSYGAPDPMAALNDPASLRGLLLQNVEKVIALEGQVAEMAPQVQALERIALADGSLCITDAAKTLQIRPKNLFTFLRSNGWIYRRPGTDTDIAYQSKLTTGVLEHKTETVHRNDGSEKVRTQVRVTPKGLTILGKLLPPTAVAA